MWFSYSLRFRVADGATPDEGVVLAVFNEASPDSMISEPGALSLTGVTQAPDIHALGETLRGVLNRAVFALNRAGYVIEGEGWDAELTEEPSDDEEEPFENPSELFS